MPTAFAQIGHYTEHFAEINVKHTDDSTSAVSTQGVTAQNAQTKSKFRAVSLGLACCTTWFICNSGAPHAKLYAQTKANHSSRTSHVANGGRAHAPQTRACTATRT